MKNKRYISCTDKRVVITFVISIIMAILASIKLYIGGTHHLITWIIILTVAYLGWIVSLSLLGILLIGVIEKIRNSKNHN